MLGVFLLLSFSVIAYESGETLAAILLFIPFVLCVPILLLAALHKFGLGGRCLCILAEDRLYFFGCDCVRKQLCQRNADGFVYYSAIREMTACSPSRGTGHVVLRDKDFEVKIDQLLAGLLVRGIRKRHPHFEPKGEGNGLTFTFGRRPTPPSATAFPRLGIILAGDPIVPAQSHILEAVRETCRAGGVAVRFDKKTELLSIRDDGETVEITARRDGREIAFRMDNDNVHMTANGGERGLTHQTVPLTQFENTATLWSLLRRFCSL